MVTNAQIANNFATGINTHKTANNMFIDGNTIYSYGYHYPLATHINDNVVLINDRGYSNTTAKHINHVRVETSLKKQYFLTKVHANYFIADTEHDIKKLFKARKPQIWLNRLNNRVQHMEQFIFNFGTPIDRFNSQGIKFSDVVIKNKVLKLINQVKKLNKIYS